MSVDPDYVAGFYVQAQGSGILGHGAYAPVDWFMHIYHDTAAGNADERYFFQALLGEGCVWIYEPELGYDVSLSEIEFGAAASSRRIRLSWNTTGGLSTFGYALKPGAPLRSLRLLPRLDPEPTWARGLD